MIILRTRAAMLSVLEVVGIVISVVSLVAFMAPDSDKRWTGQPLRGYAFCFVPSKFKAVLARFFDADSLELCPRKILQPPEDFSSHILRCGHPISKFRNLLVQVLVIENFNYFLFDKRVQFAKIRNHSRRRFDRPGKRHFNHVVVPVSVWAVALAVETPVFLRAKLRI